MILIIAFILFGLTVFAGMIMGILNASKVSRPLALSIAHGLLAISAITLLGVAVLTGTAPAFKLALGLFVAAALVGMFLISCHIRDKEPPLPVIVVHVLLAASAFVALIANIGTVRV